MHVVPLMSSVNLSFKRENIGQNRRFQENGAICFNTVGRILRKLQEE